MTDTIHISGQAVLSCSCERDCITLEIRNVELHDLTEHLERWATLKHGWGPHGTCPQCQAPSDADQAEVEKADAQRREEATA